MYSLRLFGGLALEGPSGPLTGRVVQRRRLALLALLSVAGEKGLSRDKLAGYLWPESDEANARHLLSDSLYVLRRALGEDAILAMGEFLRLNPEVVWCDAVAFEAAIRRQKLEEAVDLYTGPFLDGFYLGAAGELDQWVETERRRLADAYAKALESLAERAESASQHTVAVEWWKRLTAHDPYNSRVVLRLMQALAAAGDPANALDYARVHQLRVREELGIEPPEDLQAYAERLRKEPVQVSKAAKRAAQVESRVSPTAVLARPTEGAKGIRRVADEIHRRSLWQVLLVYIGAAWACFELIDTITNRFGIPEWLPALAAVLFLLGLPFIVATALVREVAPPAVAAPEAEPHVVEAEAAAARLEGRPTHRFLTWRSAGLTFLSAFALWGVVAAGWLLLGDRGAVAEEGAVSRKAVAVLPLENLSPDPENEFFAAGIHEDILSQLTKIADLRVISRTSVLQYVDTDKPIPQIAEELGVDAILEGSVRRAGDQVRVATLLIDAQSDAHLWSETYDRELTVANVFEIQSEIAEQISNALQAELTSEEKRRISSPPTADLEAYDYYLRGLEYGGRSYDERDMRIAVEMFEKATQLDSSFARAYAKLSELHSLFYWLHYDRSQERLQRAKQAVDRSLELEPDLPETHGALGWYYYHGHLDYERALQEFETALSQQPGNSDLLLGMGAVERRRGNVRVALTHLKNAAELDPRAASKVYQVAQTHGQLLRDYPEAEHYYDRVLALAPDRTRIYGRKAWNYICWEGNTSKARAVFEEAADRGLDCVDNPFVGYTWVLVDLFDGNYEAALARLSSGSSTAFSTQYYYIPKALLAAEIYDLMNEPERASQQYDSALVLLEAGVQEAPEDSRLYGALGIAYAGLGRVDEAIRAGERGVDLLPVSKEAFRGLYRVEELARILTMTGQHDAAIDRIEFLLSAPGDVSVARLRLDPRWAPLRDHPRFQALLERYQRQE